MKEKGFTLIEVILVIVIMAIAIPSLIMGVSFMTQRQVNALGTTTAADLAQERLERIMADKRNPLVGFSNLTNARYPAETPVAGFTQYNRSVNIICVTAADLSTSVACPTDYRRVQVTVQAVGVGVGLNVPDAVLVTLVTNY